MNSFQQTEKLVGTDSAITEASGVLPQSVRELMAACPKAGQGVNNWLFRAAIQLNRLRLAKDMISQVLKAATAKCGRYVSGQEINRAITNSEACLRDPNRRSTVKLQWPEPNLELIEAITGAGPRLADLRDQSPVKWDDSKPHTEEIIDTLFPGNPLLCVGQSEYVFNTMAMETWRGRLVGRQFIVPSPMSSVWGLTQEGKKSKHTLSNTGPRKFLVAEFDTGSFDQHAALLVDLAQYSPFAMAVHSGGKSLHGWFHVAGRDESTILKFMQYAVSLGADRATWLRSQFVRLPDGRRDDGKRQQVVYFNPKTVEAK